jgi:hypothetical protein
MGIGNYQRDESGMVRARVDQIRQTLDRFGHLIVFAPQYGVAAAGTAWDGNEEPLRHVDALFSVSAGSEAGRNLDGAIRTRIAGRDLDRSTLESFAEEHLGEKPSEDPDRLPTDLAAIEWASIRVQLEGTAIHARHAVFRGYECIAFGVEDRAISSIFSVVDASRLEARFVTASQVPL